MKLGCNDESDWSRTLAIGLAHSDDVAQAKFFHAFAAECRSWGYLKAESQLASVNLNLSDEDRELLRMIGYEDAK